MWGMWTSGYCKSLRLYWNLNIDSMMHWHTGPYCLVWDLHCLDKDCEKENPGAVSEENDLGGALGLVGCWGVCWSVPLIVYLDTASQSMDMHSSCERSTAADPPLACWDWGRRS
jgi:hypothetical protein